MRPIDTRTDQVNARAIKLDPTHPFAVDRHLGRGIDPQTGNLGNVADALHVRRITTRAEDDGYLGLGVYIVRSDERAGCVVDEGCELDWNVLG